MSSGDYTELSKLRVHSICLWLKSPDCDVFWNDALWFLDVFNKENLLSNKNILFYFNFHLLLLFLTSFDFHKMKHKKVFELFRLEIVTISRVAYIEINQYQFTYCYKIYLITTSNFFFKHQRYCINSENYGNCYSVSKKYSHLTTQIVIIYKKYSDYLKKI